MPSQKRTHKIPVCQPNTAASAGAADAVNASRAEVRDSQTHCVILDSTSPHPLAGWQYDIVPGGGGVIHLMMDRLLRCEVLQMHAAAMKRAASGGAITHTPPLSISLTFPTDDNGGPGHQQPKQKLPNLILLVQNLHRHFALVAHVRDTNGVCHRICVSNRVTTTRVQQAAPPGGGTATLPLRLASGWNTLHMALARVTWLAFGATYHSTCHVQVHANCRLRLVAFSSQNCASTLSNLTPSVLPSYIGQLPKVSTPASCVCARTDALATSAKNDQHATRRRKKTKKNTKKDKAAVVERK